MEHAPADKDGSLLRPSEELSAEIDRVGMSHTKVGHRDDLLVIDLGDYVKIIGPPRETPRRGWQGTEQAALGLLATLSDDAGIEAFWNVFSG